MRAHFRSAFLVVLSAVLNASLVSAIPLDTLQNRANGTFLSCLEHAGLDPVVQGETAYTADSTPFNLRCVRARLWTRSTRSRSYCDADHARLLALQVQVQAGSPRLPQRRSWGCGSS